MSRIEEFQDWKLGLILHWGIYSVRGVTESWSFFKGEISHEDYMAQCAGFTAKNYNPDDWARLFCEAGVKYTVLTTKHHDGVALWDTKQSDLNVVKQTPAGRDLIAPYVQAMREAGIWVGFYFSHLDWNHPEYPCLHPDSDEWWASSPYNSPQGPDDFAQWERFLQFHRAQLRELMTQYGTVDLLWFDGDWERTPEQWRFRELRDELKAMNPNVILNSRMGGCGDYKTPEQGVPIHAPEGPWELCMTLNDSWMYNAQASKYKSLRQVVRTFTECIGMGGNLLLGLGPKEDGTFDELQTAFLKELGRWIAPRAEAIYNTRAGLPHGHFTGSSTLSKDRTCLYLFFYDIPVDQLCVKGIRNNIRRISVLGDGRELTYERVGGFERVPGLLWINLPREAADPTCTTIKVELDGALDLYAGQGDQI